MRLLLLAAIAACQSREAPPPPSTPAPAPAPRAPSFAWSGEPIEPQVVMAQPIKLALGDDLTSALVTPNGWIGTKLRMVGSAFVDDIVDVHGVIASERSARLVAGDGATYVVSEREDAPPRVARIAGRALVPMTGDTGLGWAFGGIGIANDSRAGLASQHWQTIAIDHDKLSVIESSQGSYATGATRIGAEIIVATREHDPKASTDDKAAALIAATQGDRAALSGIVGQPRGWLLHVDAKGHVASTELFADQTPGQVAATSSGWLVIATEGTTRTMFKDGVLLGRAPNDPVLHVLARDLELGSQLIAAGDWACLFTMPGDGRVVHCVDPVRRLHVASQVLPDNVTLYGIELAPTPRLVLHHSWYRDGYAKPVVEDTLALPLP